MKYLVLLADGMADYPLSELGGKTPLEVAHVPHMDYLAQEGFLGLVDTIPSGMKPGSDVANLSILGYDPRTVYPGRAPLEAASMGIRLGPTDVAFRCNLVTLGEGPEPVMVDFSADHIESDEARQLIEGIDRVLRDEKREFYAGVSYRHLMVWRGGEEGMETTPPHDITGQVATPHLPKGVGATYLIEIMEKAQAVLKDHPVNVRRRQKGKKPANGIWLWGQGRAPLMERITDRYGIRGGVISAVDLLKGIGVYAGLEIISVPGITGYIDTNFHGKATYAMAALREMDFVFVHVEAPDEMGHEGNIEGKIMALERIDKDILGYVLEESKHINPLRILLLSDHPTPIKLRTHASDPSPFVLWSSLSEEKSRTGMNFSEGNAHLTGNIVSPGHKLIELLFKGWRRGK
ncbi:MAG: cofactor-independent phosphoglycerate mutase [Syntrophales bacterium]|nr:cofactor-independent phosphoglycerate mutase [Syntrophales bacterium]